MKFANFLIVSGVSLSLWSCLSDNISGCGLEIAVRDKNYDNAAKVGDIVRDETLPMISYIGSLVIGSHTVSGGYYAYSVEPLSATELVHVLDTSRFVNGEYEITPVGKGDNPAILHPDGIEGTDLYIGYDVIKVPLSTNHTIWLYRTKGKLMVEPQNTPDDVSTLRVEVDGVYSTAEGGFGATVPIVYTGSVSVAKQFDVATAGAAPRFETLLAPSTGSISPLRIVFTFEDGTSETISMDIAILRNHITLVRPSYNTQTRRWDVTVMIDDKWVKINDLNII
jgi:hypothetical protein